MHNKKHLWQSVVCLFLSLLFSLQAFALQPWEISWQLVWSVANVKVSSQMCSAMEGMGADETNVYTAKISSDGAYCNLTRTEIDTGKQTHLKYYPALTAKTAAPCDVCGHANDLAVVKDGTDTALYVATAQKKTFLPRCGAATKRQYSTISIPVWTRTGSVRDLTSCPDLKTPQRSFPCGVLFHYVSKS